MDKDIDSQEINSSEDEWKLVRKNGVLIVSGGKQLDIDIVEFIRQEREEMIKHQLGEYYQPPTQDEYGD